MMNGEQLLFVTILLVTMAMFLWGRWRHDMVALASLLACVAAGLVDPGDAFSGFGHPAVVTVACVLVLSHGLQSSGAIDALAQRVLPDKAGIAISLIALVGLGAVLSGFMNNVGAMALLMPIAVQLAQRLSLTPGQVLMPLAFGTILGGMTTLIGTPPNLIVSGFRAQNGTGGFAMFDFAPVGLAVAASGIGFLAFGGWRLVPKRKPSAIEGFESGAYFTEARVLEDSKAAGLTLRDLDALLDDLDAQILGLVKNGVRVIAANPRSVVRPGDILILEAEPDSLADAVSKLGLKLEEAVQIPPESGSEMEPEPEEAPTQQSPGDSGREGRGSGIASGPAEEDSKETIHPRAAERESNGRQSRPSEKASKMDEIGLMELVILPESPLCGRSATDILLRTRYGLNLLAISRQGQQSIKRLRSIPLRSGDLLLMQGSPEVMAQFAADNGCVPLAQRELRIPDRRKAWISAIIMAASVAVATVGVLPASVAFAMGVLASLIFRTVSPRSVYGTVDWPVVVLLAALIPVATAMESTGTAAWIGRWMLDNLVHGQPILALGLVLIVTMFLSDVMNNAATAAVMCPIAVSTAAALDVNADSFLMAVAIGASCAFLTPIGHQNNTLILGPGGFGFGDYWKLGLPLELIVIGLSIPLLLLVWPL